ncbi:MAG: helix-turn-helix domain-containing protein, partial [Thiohalomonadales bacterium]
QFLSSLDWPGNVRQLENTCRWISVMSPGKMIHRDGLPAELIAENTQVQISSLNWVDGLREWANQKLHNGEVSILEIALPDFERTLIESALNFSGGRRQDAAKLLGWGRNTLTRKIKELKMDE